MLQQTANRFMFLYKFFHSPKYIGSITPSSTFLANKMFHTVKWDEVKSIIELGAGTGVFTKYIHEHINPFTQTLIYEKDFQMKEKLQLNYPNFHLYSDANQLSSHLNQLAIEEADVIISGLPFANFSKEETNKILQAVYHSLKPRGQFIAFQYSLQMKQTLEELFHQVDIQFVPFNIPPAFVYICKK